MPLPLPPPPNTQTNRFYGSSLKGRAQVAPWSVVHHHECLQGPLQKWIRRELVTKALKDERAYEQKRLNLPPHACAHSCTLSPLARPISFSLFPVQPRSDGAGSRWTDGRTTLCLLSFFSGSGADGCCHEEVKRWRRRQ